MDDEIGELKDVVKLFDMPEDTKVEPKKYDFKSAITTTIYELDLCDYILSKVFHCIGYATNDELDKIELMREDVGIFQSRLLRCLSQIYKDFECSCTLEYEEIFNHRWGKNLFELNDEIQLFFDDRNSILLNIIMRKLEMTSTEYNIIKECYGTCELIEVGHKEMLEDLVKVKKSMNHIEDIKKDGKLPGAAYDFIIGKLVEKREGILKQTRTINEILSKMRQYEQIQNKMNKPLVLSRRDGQIELSM
jgi:hypothetical protein